jgi:tetratricopeptide (TPR) repeat protein
MALGHMLMQHRCQRFLLRFLFIAQAAILLQYLAYAGTLSSETANTTSLDPPSGALVSPNRLAVAVVGFGYRAGHLILEPCWSSEQQLAIGYLKESKALRILPNSSVEYALRQTNATNNAQDAEGRVQKLSHLLGAQRVVLSQFQHQGEKWLLTGRLMDVTTGVASKEFKASSTNVFDIAKQLAVYVVQELKVHQTEAERRRFGERSTNSPIALEWYCRAWALASDGGPAAEQENCYRQAIKADPHFAAAYGQLAALLAYQGKRQEAEKMARDALEMDPAALYAHRILAALFWSQRKNDQAEAEFGAVTTLDPDDASAFAHLGYLNLEKGQQSKAIADFEMAARLEPYGPEAASVHAQLGYIYAQQRYRDKAMAQLEESERRVSSGDILAELFLGHGYTALNETALAVKHCERFIRLATERATFPEEIKAFEKFVAEAKPTLKPTWITNAPPKNYTRQELNQVLERKLNHKELRLTVNPLASSDAMARWAKKITEAATNDIQKAGMLFDVLKQRVPTDGLNLHSHSLTAQEVYAKWNEPGFLMECQQGTFLFVALGRAVGLRAYAVNVHETFDGGKSPHACAAVYVGNDALLVDLTYPWFGAPHQSFTVLDDLQAVAVHLCMGGDLERSRIATKLAPELALVEASLCGNLINAGRWSEAQELLPLVVRVDMIGAMTTGLQAAFAMHEGQVALAETLLHKAIGLDPRSSSLRFQLGNAYLAEGRLKEARESFESALRCLHTKEQAEVLKEAIGRIGNLTPAEDKPQTGVSQ